VVSGPVDRRLDRLEQALGLAEAGRDDDADAQDDWEARLEGWRASWLPGDDPETRRQRERLYELMRDVCRRAAQEPRRPVVGDPRAELLRRLDQLAERRPQVGPSA
jgi:hypothetical protein